MAAQRKRAAFLAIRERSSALMFAARAFPPLRPIGRCGWVYAPVLWRPFSIINFARRDINNELGELSRIARVLHPGMAFRHRDSSDEE